MQPAAPKSQPFVSQSSPTPVVTGSGDSPGAAPQFAGMTVTRLPAPQESRRTETTQRAGEGPVAVGSVLRGEHKGADATQAPVEPFDNLVLEVPEGLVGIQWHIRHQLGREVSTATLYDDVGAVLDAVSLRGDDADTLLGAEVARQAGGRSMSRTQLETIISASVAHTGRSIGAGAMAWLSRFLMGVNNETGPVGQTGSFAVPTSFHDAVVSCLLREGGADGRQDLDYLQDWCRGTLQRGILKEFAAVLKAALTAPAPSAGDGLAAGAAATPGELARRLRAVMDGVAQTDHLAAYLQCARSYVDKSPTFDAPTRAALQGELATTRQPVAGGDRKASASESREATLPKRPTDSGQLGMGGVMGLRMDRPDPPLSADKAAGILAECRKSLPRPVSPDAWAGRVLQAASCDYGPTALRRLGAEFATQAGGAGLEAPRREAILRACLLARAQAPYLVTVAGLRAFLVGMDGVFRGGSLADAVTFYAEVIRSIVETDPAFFGEGRVGLRHVRDLLTDWSVDFTKRYPIHALRPLLAVAVPATGDATSATTSTGSGVSSSPTSGPAGGIHALPATLGDRLGAMIVGVDWITHGPALRQLVQSYIATAGFPAATQTALTQVLDEILPADSKGKARVKEAKAQASPTGLG